MNKDYDLFSNDSLTQLVKSKQINSWNALIEFVRSLPYGRNSNRFDFKLVIEENKGTCSAKHAFLKKIADLNNIPNVKLILGIYKMSVSNTPKIGRVLIENKIDFIPEAHCYLKIEGTRMDYTTVSSDFKKIGTAILHEKEIEPEQVVDFKVKYHQYFLRNWIREVQFNLDFETLWKIREKCIESLSV